MSSYKVKKTIGDTDWFVRDRFGMFIHFGLYALPARHEWIKQKDMISEEKYDEYFKYFNPDMFNAKEWARLAKDRRLIGFERLHDIAPGGSAKAEFTVNPCDLEIYMEEAGKKVIEPGKYRIYAGGSCLDERVCAEIEL